MVNGIKVLAKNINQKIRQVQVTRLIISLRSKVSSMQQGENGSKNAREGCNEYFSQILAVESLHDFSLLLHYFYLDLVTLIDKLIIFQRL